MGIIEDIKRMQLEGRQEQDIANVLQSRGYAPQEIAEALAQARIKEAVAAPSSSDSPDSSSPSPSAPSSMQPSMLNQEQAEESPEQLPTEYPSPASAATTEYGQPYTATATQPYGAYQDTGYYAAGPSADTIAEIADQVIAEKLHPLQQDFAALIDRSHLFESKLSELDERLKRIERILDRLQLAILQKVGEYMSNVSDLKNEIVETQKSFKSLLPASATTAAQAAE